MENDKYIPRKPNYYNYKGKQLLNGSYYNDILTYKKINICAYKVNNEYLYPFLNFLLIKKEIDNTLILPSVSIFKNFSIQELINYSKVFLFGFSDKTDFEIFNDLIEFNGFYEFNNNLYLFFDITKVNFKQDNEYNTQIWFSLVHEIANCKKICNLNINEEIIELFSANDELCFLTDENNKGYESPIVGYINKPRDKANYTYIFGEPSRDKNSIFGPYFYFTDFENAINIQDTNLNINSNLKSDGNNSIIRFALFMGHTNYVENRPNDPIDNSEIKIERLKDTNLDQNIEYLTIRISDHDGKWSTKYDSIYLGNVELDNGTYLKNTPMIVVKIYEQQIPLSYHYINNKSFMN